MFSKIVQWDSELTWDKAKRICCPKKGTAITLTYGSALILWVQMRIWSSRWKHMNQSHEGQQCQSPHETKEYAGKMSSAEVFAILHHRITQWLQLGGISGEHLVQPLCQCRFTQSRLHRITSMWTLNMSRGDTCQHCSAVIMPSCCWKGLTLLLLLWKTLTFLIPKWMTYDFDCQIVKHAEWKTGEGQNLELSWHVSPSQIHIVWSLRDCELAAVSRTRTWRKLSNVLAWDSQTSIFVTLLRI